MVNVSTNQSASGPSTELRSLQNAIQFLLEGLQELIRMNSSPDGESSLRSNLMNYVEFGGDMLDWCSKLPTQRVRDTLFSLIRHIYQFLQDAVRTGLMPAPEDQKTSLLPHLRNVLMEIGPNLVISNDRMAAFVMIPSELSIVWSAEDLKEYLRKKGIVFGLEEDRIDALFTQGQFDRIVRVALGKAPVIGANASLEDPLKLFSKIRMPSAKKAHFLDYKAHHLFVPVKKGDLIMRKIPAKAGEGGCDIFGQAIESPAGLDRPIPPIENCQLDHSGLQLFSKVDGCAYTEQKRVFVLPSLLINGNVDFETGDIDANVSVTVAKDVLAGLKVKSTKDVAVKGVIESCDITAGGSIFCQCGVNGKGNANIRARHNIEAVHISDSKVTAGDYITISGPIINSEITARRVTAIGANGQIIGGVIRAWEDVCAAELGSKMGIRTELILGGELEDLRYKVAEMTEKMKALKSQKSQAEAALRQLHSTSNADKSQVEAMIEGIKKTAEELALMQLEYDALMVDLAYSETCVRMVRVAKILHPGVCIRILNHSLTFRDEHGPMNIKYSSSGLVTLPFSDRTFDGDEIEGKE